MNEYEFWCGSEESYEVVLRAQASVQVMLKTLADSGDDPPGMPPTWSKEGSLAIIPVVGSLIQGKAGWMAYFGAVGYDDIVNALTAAVADPDVKSILLTVKSGGGAANGAQDTADYIRTVSGVKPVSAHMQVGASAAYWIASAATPGRLSLDPMGITGSIGAVQIHTSYARALAADGIDKTVVRSGEFKMLGNPIEPLSEAGKAEMQSQVNDVSGMFESHVGKMRGGISAADVREQMGKGKTFLGKRALAAGLVDKVLSYDQAVASAKKN